MEDFLVNANKLDPTCVLDKIYLNPTHVLDKIRLDPIHAILEIWDPTRVYPKVYDIYTSSGTFIRSLVSESKLKISLDLL